jgi:hypothetical protein
MKISKKLLATILTLTAFLAMFTLLPITTVATEYIDVDDYCWIEGVLHNDTYTLYPYAQQSMDIGFSKYGELIGYNEDTEIGVAMQYPGYTGAADPDDAPDGTYDQRIGTSVDPFANEEIGVDWWMRGWFIDIKYTPLGAADREIWAFAMFSDGARHGGDWIVMPSVGPNSDARPLWQEHPPYANPDATAYSGILTPAEIDLLYGGRKTNGHAETDPIEIIYNGPRRFIAICRTRISDIGAAADLIDLTFTIIFNKAEKNVIILKDVKRLYKKSPMNIQFGNRGEWDLGISPDTDSYIHWYTDQPVQFWDMDGLGTITAEEEEQSFEFFKKYFLQYKHPKKWWDEVPESEKPSKVADEWTQEMIDFPEEWLETRPTCYGREWHMDDTIKEHSYAVAQVISQKGDYVGAYAVWPHPEFWAAHNLYYPPYRTTLAGGGFNPSSLTLMLRPISRMLEWNKWTVVEDPTSDDYPHGYLDDRTDVWVKVDDVVTATGTTKEPIIPFTIAEHDFELSSSLPAYRIVSVYTLTDNHDGDDADAQRGGNSEDWSNGVNQIDREIQYQLDEIFDPWDIYDAMHKNTKRWVEFFDKGVASPTTPWISGNKKAWDGETYYCIELPSSREIESGKDIPSLPVYPGFEPGTRPADWDNDHGYTWDAYCAETERVLVDTGTGYELIPRGITTANGDCTLTSYTWGYHWLDPTKVEVGDLPDGRRFYTINMTTGRMCFYEFDDVTETFQPWYLPEDSMVKVLWSSEHHETTAEQWDEDHLLYPVDGERIRFPLNHDIMCKYKNLTEVFLIEQPPERLFDVPMTDGTPWYEFSDPDLTVHNVSFCKEVDVKYYSYATEGSWHEEKFHKDTSAKTDDTFTLAHSAAYIEKVWIHSEKALTGGQYVFHNETQTVYMQDPVADGEWLLVNYTIGGYKYTDFFLGDGETTEFELHHGGTTPTAYADVGSLIVQNTEIQQQIVNHTDTIAALGIRVPKIKTKIWWTEESGVTDTYEGKIWERFGILEEREWIVVTENKTKGNWIIRESPVGDYFSTCDELVLEQPPLNSTQVQAGDHPDWPGQELKIVFKVPSGRWEWSIVGEPSVAVDSIGVTMTVAAFKNKLMEFGLGGLDIQDTTYGPRVPSLIREGISPDSIGRYHLCDDWCYSRTGQGKTTSWPIASSNIITVGGPYPNMISKYFNEFAQAMIFTTVGDGFYGVTCWDKTLSEHGFYEGGEVDDRYGYAVISTYKDKNGTIGFMVYGWTGQDTYYAAKWFDEHKFELQHINLHVTDLILEIEYEDSDGDLYCPPTVSIVEKLGTISEKPQHDC